MGEKLSEAQMRALHLLKQRPRLWNPKSSTVAALVRRELAVFDREPGQPYALVGITRKGIDALSPPQQQDTPQ